MKQLILLFALAASAWGQISSFPPSGGSSPGASPAGSPGALQTYLTSSAFSGTVITGIVKANGASVPSAAAFADLPITGANLVSKFTGCSGTQYLGADGACHSGNGVVTGGIPCGSTVGQAQLFASAATFGCGPLTFTNEMGAGGYVLTAGAALPPFDPNITGFLSGQTYVGITPVDYGQIVMVCTSDGYCGNQWNSAFKAAMGDVDNHGNPATPGTVYYIGSMWIQREDTTNAVTTDWGIDIASSVTNRPLAGNEPGDVGIGLVNLTYPSGMPTVVSDANFYLKADGTVATIKALKTTGSATGKTAVCADANGQLYRSSASGSCAN